MRMTRAPSLAWSFPPFRVDRSGRQLRAAGGELADPEDHELGRLDRADADLDHDLPCLDYRLRIRLGVALDVEGLLRRRAEQCALAPGAVEEVRRRDAQ